MTLAEILANKELGDDQEISLGDKGTFKLGDLRGIATERETLRGERETLARERDDYRGKFETVSAATAKLMSEAGTAAERELSQPAAKTPAETLREALSPLLSEDDGTKALFDDKVFGKALKTVEDRAYARAAEKHATLEAEIKEMRENLTKGFEGLTRAQLAERAERWYDINRSDIPKGESGKKMTLQEIHQFAVDRNMVRPGTQILDYDRALEVLTEPQRIEAKMTEAEKRGYEKGLEMGRAAAGKVIPIFGDRSGGDVPGDKISTVGKSARQIVAERLQQGLADLSAAENE